MNNDLNEEISIIGYNKKCKSCTKHSSMIFHWHDYVLAEMSLSVNDWVNVIIIF